MSIIGIERPQATTQWEVAPEQSLVEFDVKHWWGSSTVTGRFTRFEGSYVTGPDGAAIVLTIDAASAGTGNRLRDRHLRSADYFAAEAHPQLRFASSQVVELAGGVLQVTGTLEVAGNGIPLSFEAAVRELDGGLEIEAETAVDQRLFGMSRGPLWNVRPPARLHVRTRLVPSGQGS